MHSACVFLMPTVIFISSTVAEFDTPYNLLANPDSIFYSMCTKSGDLAELKETAARRQTWSSKETNI